MNRKLLTLLIVIISIICSTAATLTEFNKGDLCILSSGPYNAYVDNHEGEQLQQHQQYQQYQLQLPQQVKYQHQPLPVWQQNVNLPAMAENSATAGDTQLMLDPIWCKLLQIIHRLKQCKHD